MPFFDVMRQPGEQGGVTVQRFDHDHERVRLGAHRHEAVELLYFDVVDGTDGVHRVGGRTLPVRQGDVHLVPPFVPHDVSGAGRAAGWVLELTVDAVVPVQPGAVRSPTSWRQEPLLLPFADADVGDGPSFATVPEADRPDWERRFARLQREFRERRLGHAEARVALVQLVLVDVARLTGARDGRPGRSGAGDPVVDAVFAAIDHEFTGSTTLGEIAATVGFTPGYLTSTMRERTGRTVVDWLNERRMSEARRLLLTTDLSVEQVALRSGFDDASYFSRRFRRKHELAPTEWRTRAADPG